jgi:hypothetical protein
LNGPLKGQKRRREAMFSVSQKANEMIAEFFKGRQEPPSVRILMQGGG